MLRAGARTHEWRMFHYELVRKFVEGQRSLIGVHQTLREDLAVKARCRITTTEMLHLLDRLYTLMREIEGQLAK